MPYAQILTAGPSPDDIVTLRQKADAMFRELYNSPPLFSPMGFYNFGPGSLPKFRAALAKVRRGTANATIACIGDSTTRGVGAAAGTAAFLNGYPPQLASMLAAPLGVALSANNAIGSGNVTLASNDSRVALTGGSQGAVNATLGGALFQLTASGHTFAFTPGVAADTFDIYSVKTGATGSFTINLDGGSTLATVSGLIAGGGMVKTTVTGTLATHTLNCVWGSGTCYVVGVHAYDSTSKKVQILNLGASGVRSSNLADTTNGYAALNAIPIYAADLTILDCGINDWSNAVSISTYTANMQAVIVQALTTGDVMLVTPVPSAQSVAGLAVQQPYITALYGLAQAYNLPLIDAWARFGTYEALNGLGLYSDTLHPNGVGYADFTALIKNAIVGLV